MPSRKASCTAAMPSASLISCGGRGSLDYKQKCFTMCMIPAHVLRAGTRSLKPNKPRSSCAAPLCHRACCLRASGRSAHPRAAPPAPRPLPSANNMSPPLPGMHACRCQCCCGPIAARAPRRPGCARNAPPLRHGRSPRPPRKRFPEARRQSQALIPPARCCPARGEAEPWLQEPS